MTSKIKVVQSKGWLSIGRMDALHHNYKKRGMFQGAWRGLEPEISLGVSINLLSIVLSLNIPEIYLLQQAPAASRPSGFTNLNTNFI